MGRKGNPLALVTGNKCLHSIFAVISLTQHVRYYTREDAENAMRYVNGTRLDDRIIRTDWDTGFKEGRQFGRGKTGGQVCAVVCYVVGGVGESILPLFKVI